jgi:hypothetical protein
VKHRAALPLVAAILVAGMAIGALEGAGVLWKDDDDAPPSPGPAWATAIPAGFPLARGLPRPGGDNGPRRTSDRRDEPWTLGLCGTTASPTDAARVAFRSVVQPIPAAGHTRQLALYPDADAAHAVLEDFRRRLADCPAVTIPDGGPAGDATVRWQARPFGAGEEALIATAIHGDAVFASHHAVVRVGNAVYAQTYDGEFGGAPEGADAVDRRARPVARRMAERMCIFAASPCRRRE